MKAYTLNPLTLNPLTLNLQVVVVLGGNEGRVLLSLLPPLLSCPFLLHPPLVLRLEFVQCIRRFPLSCATHTHTHRHTNPAGFLLAATHTHIRRHTHQHMRCSTLPGRLREEGRREGELRAAACQKGQDTWERSVLITLDERGQGSDSSGADSEVGMAQDPLARHVRNVQLQVFNVAVVCHVRKLSQRGRELSGKRRRQCVSNVLQGHGRSARRRGPFGRRKRRRWRSRSVSKRQRPVAGKRRVDFVSSRVRWERKVLTLQQGCVG